MGLANSVDASTTGFQSLNATTGIWNGRSLTAGTGVSITNNDGTGGNPTFSATGLTSVVTQTFTANGTYTPTAGMQFAMIEVVGGGGGGGGGAAGVVIASGTSAASGGASGYARGLFTAASIGVSQAVTVGAAGAGGSAGNNTGSTGGTSSVGALISATGGLGGGGSPSFSLATGAIQLVANGGNGGSGAGGDFQTTGATGGDSFINAVVGAGNLAYNLPGGSTYFGGGASGVSTAGGSTTGEAATSYGGGGSGGVAIGVPNVAVAGGAGVAGIVYIVEYI